MKLENGRTIVQMPGLRRARVVPRHILLLAKQALRRLVPVIRIQ